MEDRKVKGSVLLGYMNFVKSTWGQDGLDSMISSIPNAELQADMWEDTWYDDELSMEILSWIAKNKGEENLERCGKATVKDLGFLSFIVDYMDIRSILEKGSENFHTAFNNGSFDVELGDRRAVIKVKGRGSNNEYACQTWTGVFKGMLELTKTNGTVTETQCERDGADHCEFLMEWDAPVEPGHKMGRLR
ncbi:MAG: DUF2378 family protein [Thermoplasmata archaeon]|nr:DUF2378 family protein [Thermoplasmata archaeon]